jgi:hypothetical protein
MYQLLVKKIITESTAVRSSQVRYELTAIKQHRRNPKKETALTWILGQSSDLRSHCAAPCTTASTCLLVM